METVERVHQQTKVTEIVFRATLLNVITPDMACEALKYNAVINSRIAVAGDFQSGFREALQSIQDQDLFITES